MTDVELHITLAVTVDAQVWRETQFIEKGLADDVPEYVRQVVADSAAAHFDHAIKTVRTLKVEHAKS
jgi:hypothetical protein